MKKLFALTLFGCVALSLLTTGVEKAVAIPAFKTEFDNMYVDKTATTGPKKDLADACEKVKCNVCHVGKVKKDKNEYGKALDVLLDKKKDIKDVEKIKASLKAVEAQPSDPANAKSPTFGDLIKQGKLPGGEEK